MRTFNRVDWNAAQAAWKDGHFSDGWKPYRHQAAMRGILYPPDGDRYDSWEDDEPSQRAMLIRSIRETPKLTTAAIAHSHSWGEVVAYIIRRRDDMREELDDRDREITRRRAEEIRPREAVSSIKAILNRIADS
jgi:hypothetical protein